MEDLVVLITVFNDEEGLKKVLHSIREPDYSFTVLIVDDGSEKPLDLTGADFDFDTVVLRLEENRGTSVAANTGLKWIRERDFKFVARLDAGDLQRPDRLSIQYKHLNKNPDLVLLGTNAVFRCESTDRVLFETALPTSWESIKRWSIFHNCFIHPTVMFRVNEIDPAHEYCDKYRYIDDYVFLKEIAESHPSEVLAASLLECYVRKNGLSQRFNKEQLLCGLRHHLDHPRPLNILWYAYILKRVIYLALPFRLKVAGKKFFIRSRILTKRGDAIRQTLSQEA